MWRSSRLPAGSCEGGRPRAHALAARIGPGDFDSVRWSRVCGYDIRSCKRVGAALQSWLVENLCQLALFNDDDFEDLLCELQVPADGLRVVNRWRSIVHGSDFDKIPFEATKASCEIVAQRSKIARIAKSALQVVAKAGVIPAPRNAIKEFRTNAGGSAPMVRTMHRQGIANIINSICPKTQIGYISGLRCGAALTVVCGWPEYPPTEFRVLCWTGVF